MVYVLLLNRLKSISGGVERMVVNYANFLTAEGNDVVVITLEKKSGLPFYSLHNEVQYFGLGKISLEEKSSIPESIKRLRNLRSLVKILSPDYLIAFQFGPYKIAALSTLLLGQRVVLMERNSPQRHNYVSEGSSVFRSIWLLLAYRIAVQFPEYMQYYPRLFRAKMIVSRNFTEIESKISARTMCTDILFVGRYGFQKDTDRVFKVFNYLAPFLPHINFHMIGDGLKEHYVSRFQNVKIHMPLENWHEVGLQPIVVLLSRFEGCPNVFLEAMSLGIPCFGLHGVDGIHSLLMDDRGFLSKNKDIDEIGNDLRLYITDAELSNRHRLNAYEYVQTFHEKTTVVSEFLVDLHG